MTQQGPEGRGRLGFLGRKQRAPTPPARGLRECYKLSQWGRGFFGAKPRLKSISILQVHLVQHFEKCSLIVKLAIFNAYFMCFMEFRFGGVVMQVLYLNSNSVTKSV